MISGDLGYVQKERFQELREEIGDVERMLKAMIKSLENKHLDPRILDSWNPFSQLNEGFQESRVRVKCSKIMGMSREC